jgi:hypothetical protein
MTVEERLRRAMDDEVASVETDPAAWQRVQAEVARRRRARMARVSLLTAAALVAASVATVALATRDDARQVETIPAGRDSTTTTIESSTTTTTIETTTTSVATPPAEREPYEGIWPFTSQAEADAYEADPGVGMFFDAEATALEFARTYLGMPDPVRDSLTRHEDEGATVVVRPKAASPVKTRLELVGGPDGPWTVWSATTEHIQVDEPGFESVIGSPVHVAGTSLAFEAVVRVEVREDGQAFGQSLGASTVMGGGTEVAPFRGDIAFDTPTKRAGAVVFFTDSAEDGSIVEATVVRVAFAD